MALHVARARIGMIALAWAWPVEAHGAHGDVDPVDLSENQCHPRRTGTKSRSKMKYLELRACSMIGHGHCVVPDAMSTSGLMIAARSSLHKSLPHRESTKSLPLQSHLLPSAADAPLMMPTMSTPTRAAILLSGRTRVDQLCVGCGSPSMIMSAAGRTRETMLPTQPSRTKLV